MIDLSDSYVDCSDSLILIEPDSIIAHSEFAAETDTHSREIGNKSKRTSLVTHEDCCSYHCLSYFTASDVITTSEYFKTKSIIDQNQFLLDSFNQESTNHIICESLCTKKPTSNY